MYKSFLLLSGLMLASVSHHIKAEPVNLTQIKSELTYYHDSGQYIKDIRTQVRKAKHRLLKAIADNQQKNHPKKLAIVLDIDETVLSNYQDFKRRDFGGTTDEIHREIRMAHALPIEPMRHFYDYAKQHYITLFFVTGRNESERQATVKNLKQAGFYGWQHLYLKPNHYHAKSILPFKLAQRQAIEHQGYTIVETIGDQKSDLVGGHSGATFKLPNPYYYLK